MLRQPKLSLAQMTPYDIQYTNNTILKYNLKHLGFNEGFNKENYVSVVW